MAAFKSNSLDFPNNPSKGSPTSSDILLLADVAAASTIKRATVGSMPYYQPGGTDVPVADGGTGRSTATAYTPVCGGTTTTNPLQSVASAGSSGQPLLSGGAAALPTYGTLTVGGGGTGRTTATAYTPLCGGTTTTGAHQSVASAGSTGQPLLSGGASALPSFGVLTVPGGGTGNNTMTTAYGTICAGTTATGALQTVSPGTSGKVLISAGSSALPSYGTLGVTGGGTGVATLTTAYGTLCAGTTATGAVQTVSPGTSGHVLTSNGASALPTYQAIPASSPSITTSSKTSDYTLLTTDKGKAVVFTVTTFTTVDFDDPATLGDGWYAYINNQSAVEAGMLMVVPYSGATINGSADPYPVFPGNGVLVQCDGTNFIILDGSNPFVHSYSTAYSDFVPTYPGTLSNTLTDSITTSTQADLNAYVWFWPFAIPYNFTINFGSISVHTVLASSTCNLGIYASNSSQTAPTGSPLAVANISTEFLGMQEAAMSSSVPLKAYKTYWAAVQASSNVTLALYQAPYSFQARGSGQVGTEFYSSVYRQTYTYSAGTLPSFGGAVSTGSAYQVVCRFR